MVAEVAALGAAILTVLAELLHGVRMRRMGQLVFGQSKRPALWARLSSLVRVGAVAAMTWGMVTLMLLQPKVHQSEVIADGEHKHILLRARCVAQYATAGCWQYKRPESNASRAGSDGIFLPACRNRAVPRQRDRDLHRREACRRRYKRPRSDPQHTWRSANALCFRFRRDRYFRRPARSVRNRPTMEPR